MILKHDCVVVENSPIFVIVRLGLDLIYTTLVNLLVYKYFTV